MIILMQSDLDTHDEQGDALKKLIAPSTAELCRLMPVFLLTYKEESKVLSFDRFLIRSGVIGCFC